MYNQVQINGRGSGRMKMWMVVILGLVIIQCNGSEKVQGFKKVEEVTEISEKEAKILTEGEYYFSWVQGPDTIGKFEEDSEGFLLAGYNVGSGTYIDTVPFTKQLTSGDVKIKLHSEDGSLTVIRDGKKVAKATKIPVKMEKKLEEDGGTGEKFDEFGVLNDISKLQDQVDDLNIAMKKLTNAYEMMVLFLRILALVMVIGVGLAGFAYWCLGHDEEVEFYHEENYAV